LLLNLLRARNRLGFPRLGSHFFLNLPVTRPEPGAHRYENWRAMARSLGFDLPSRDKLCMGRQTTGAGILIHTGAGQVVRVWPLDRYRNLANRLRQKNYSVQIACDPEQKEWWLASGETGIIAPETVAQLVQLLDRAALFIGNDSGPGHLAAFRGLPTFTIFGPQLPEWFAPLHPASEFTEGKACPYKPCSDYCRFTNPICLSNVSEAEIWARMERFVSKHLDSQRGVRRAESPAL
jgi:heptosyltransferase-2